MRFDPTKELSDKETLKIITEIVEHGFIHYSDHVKEQMKKRGYEAQDVEYILTNGNITKKDFSEEHQNWEYRIEGTDLDGDEGKIITAVITINRLIIITVLG